MGLIMSEQELKIILTAAFCLNKAGNSETVDDLIAYMFKQRFGIDIHKLAMYCITKGKSILPEVNRLLQTETTYRRSNI